MYLLVVRQTEDDFESFCTLFVRNVKFAKNAFTAHQVFWIWGHFQIWPKFKVVALENLLVIFC